MSWDLEFMKLDVVLTVLYGVRDHHEEYSWGLDDQPQFEIAYSLRL